MVVTHTITVKLIRLETLFTTESVALIVSLYMMEYFCEVVLPGMTANQIKRHQNQCFEDLMVSFVNSKTSRTEV